MKQHLIQGLFVVILLLKTEEVSGFPNDDEDHCSPKSLVYLATTCSSQQLHQLRAQFNEAPYNATFFMEFIDTFCSEIEDFENCTRSYSSDCDDFQQVFDANLDKRNLCVAAQSWIREYVASLGNGPIFNGTCIFDVLKMTIACDRGIANSMRVRGRAIYGINASVNTTVKLNENIRDMIATCVTTMSYDHPKLRPKCQNMNPKVAALSIATILAIVNQPGVAFTADQFEQIKNMPSTDFY